MYIYFLMFSSSWKKISFLLKLIIMNKKRNEKKKCWCRNWNELLPNCITKGKDFVLQYNQCIAKWKGLSRLGIVLQRLLRCVAIQILYCRLGGKLYRNTVHCIAAKRGLKGWVLYYNTLLCIARDLVGEAGWVTIQSLYRDCSHWKCKGKRLECIARQARDTASRA